ncbi:hypothetical protein [Granulicella tundricola]|uniref:Glycosyltransferase RgtA/B/C/D-like domain-containing protein n=1 Tax=Granulicella tundricola (strain ATCC BAA-1859 / DSM 23138 / MP5ACTX9) TaxID=1198114 RepID=E8WXZ3_GRATM|nr:hypothetical protein [Granulicella tundricola]ADW67532.1 hypothetical protein AciX9_0460 [Granulicella tundricola MP5ACTX9]
MSDDSIASIDHAAKSPVSTRSSPYSLLLAALTIAAIVFYCVPDSMADPDIWWHLRDAQLQLSCHCFLSHDLFSFTAAGSSWMNHEWLAELPFYAGFHLLQTTGLYLVTLAAIEIIFLGVLWLAYLASGSILPASIATIAGVLLSTVSFGPRTLLFGWVLLVLELLIFALSKRRTALLWALPFVFLLWVNTHGSWLIGIVLFTLFVASSWITFHNGAIDAAPDPPDTRMRLIKVWAVSVLALFANPYGWHLVFYPFDLAFRQKLNIANVEEWKSVDFHSPRGRILFVCLAVLFLLQLLRGRKWTAFELVLLAVGLYSAFTYSRFLFLAAILVGPLLAVSLASAPRISRQRLSPMLRFALIAMILCFIGGRIRTRILTGTKEDSRFPDQSLPFLATFHPQGRVFNEFLWGGFLVWHKRDTPVFIDSRVDIFEYNGTFKDYLDIVRLKDSLALLDRYQIRYVFFERDSPLIYLLKTTHHWKVDYEDNTSSLLERSEAQIP